VGQTDRKFPDGGQWPAKPDSALKEEFMKSRIWMGVGALVTAATLLSACSQAAPQSSGDEGDKALIVACGAQEDWCQAMVAAFQEKTGIDTNYIRLSSGEAVARFDASKESPEFDVWHGGPADGYEAAKDAGLLEPYTSETTAQIPDEFKDPEGYWNGVYVGVLGFCSNKDVLKSLGVDTPDSWESLLDPALKSQVGTAHPATSGTAYTTLWSQVLLHDRDEDAALDYMKKLNVNVLQYSKSGTAPGQQAGRGEIATGIMFTHDCVKYQEEGLDSLVVSVPKEGTGFEIGGVAALANAKHPSAAQQYIDFATSAETQEIGATVGSYQVPTNPNAKISDKSIDLDSVTLLDYDPVEAGKSKSTLVERFDAEVATAPTE
jgi:iron(III) transport system substrate-binding protein